MTRVRFELFSSAGHRGIPGLQPFALGDVQDRAQRHRGVEIDEEVGGPRVSGYLCQTFRRCTAGYAEVIKELDDLLAALNAGETITGDSPLHAVMHRTSQEALRITGELNGGYHEPERVRELLAELIGKPVDESVVLFPPFSSDFGKNITVGKRIFINSGCKFQDQGGLVIGDDCLIGHNTVLATLNHDLSPSRRADMHPAPIVIGRNVWIGANVTVLPGVTIGDNAVVAAASVVTKDVPENSVVVGSPARVVRSLSD